jgi:hypothetical protein
LAALKNVVLSVTKLAAVAAGAVVGTTLVLVGAWLVPAALISVGVLWWIARGRTTMQPRLAAEVPMLPPRPEITGFWGITLAWLVAGSVPGFVVPLRVAQELGLTSAAYFHSAWMIVAASSVFMSLATSPFVAAASRPDVDMRARTVEFVRFMVVVGLLRGVGLAVAGTAALYVYGPEYAEAGGPLLVVMGIVHAMSVPAYIYGALARVYRRIWYPMAVNALGSVVVVVLVSGWVERYDLLGAGYAYLAQEVVTLALCIAPLTRLLRKGLAGVRPQDLDTGAEQPTIADGWWRSPYGSTTTARFSLSTDTLTIETTDAAPLRLILDDVNALDEIGDPAGGLNEVEILMSDGRVLTARWPGHFRDAVVDALRAGIAQSTTDLESDGAGQPT